MKEHVVHVPVGSRPTLSFEWEIIHYIDKNLEIRSWYNYKGSPDFRPFPVESVSEETFDYLKRRLLEESQGIREMVCYRWEDGRLFLMVVCSGG